MSEQIDQALLALLSLLWEAAQTTPDKPWSLAKISKRSGVQMSTLLRQLNVLIGNALVQTAVRGKKEGGDATDTEEESGTAIAELTPAARDLCAIIFAAPETR
jgi:DNA-binding IscR family transcriptional regulator